MEHPIVNIEEENEINLTFDAEVLQEIKDHINNPIKRCLCYSKIINGMRYTIHFPKEEILKLPKVQ